MSNIEPNVRLTDPAAAWGKITQKMREELSEQSFHAWITPVLCRSLDAGILTLEVPDKFYGDWVREHYETLIQSVALEVVGYRPTVAYEVSLRTQFQPATSHQQKPWPDFKKKKAEREDLNARYTFDNFVIGSGNRFAHAASLAVSEELAKRYNPLFIYGRVGLGKTHLIQAIAHSILDKNAGLKIVYISSEKFTTQLISAIQSRSTPAFREKYRAADLLLIDDIHFIAGKESTQEEFFHTFNTLYDAHKQIVVTSDRPPKDIPGLEERLVSRFGWGLVADIQPPDLETRVAILKKKLDTQNASIPDDILFLIAERIKSNIRELEGALVRVLAYSSLTGTPMSKTLTETVLKDAFREEEGKVTIDQIQRLVSDFFSVKISDLRAKRRTASIVTPRQVAMFLARELTNHSLPEIGDFFGGRGHATVLHGINRVKTKIGKGGEMKRVVEQLLELVRR